MKINKTSVLGEVVGVEVYRRGSNDPHAMIKLLVNKNGLSWERTEFCMSAHWLSDLIKVLQDSQAVIRDTMYFKKRADGLGYNFRNE